MFHRHKTRKRIRRLPRATAKVNASRFAWLTMHLRMKATA